ncbi:MAG: response regulator transcription factor [Verrucomicrobiota bacterium]
MNRSRGQTKIRVLLVDDHLIVRRGIRSSFQNHPVVTIVGDAANGEEAIAKVRKLSPDVVLMDINMPGMNGMDATALIHKEFPEVKVVALTVHQSREYVLKILRSGARAYVLKDASPDEIAEAIEATFRGHAFFSPSIATIVLKDYLDTAEPQTVNQYGLSGRETEVLRLIVKGRTTKEIAGQIKLGSRTVETYRARLMRKLKVRNAAELTSTAIAHQLV